MLLRTSLLALLIATPAWAEDAPAGSADNGKALFVAQGCYECHGYVGQGGAAGPTLAPPKWNFLRFSAVLRNPPNEMPPYTTRVLSDQQLADVFAFLGSLPPPPKLETLPLLR